MWKHESPSSGTGNKLSLKSGLFYIALLTMTANAVIDLFDKWKEYYAKNYVQSYVPDGTSHMQIDDATKFETIFTGSVPEIIKRKWWYDSIPDIISYKTNGTVDTIDVRTYNTFPIAIWLFNTRGSSEISHATWLIRYLQKDFATNQCLLEDISSQRIAIKSEDSYRDKVTKIQKFVRSLGYERDLIYLGKNKTLAALSNYQLPVLANLMIGKMDCNNKTGLFIQLCRSNNILVGIWSSMTHMTPVVYSHKDDEMRKYIRANTSVWSAYNGVVVDPTNTDVAGGVRRPAITGDMTWEQYTEMKFIVAEKD